MSVLDSLQPGEPISYVVAFVLPALDAIFPVLPSETVIIALGVATAGSSDPRVALLVVLAAAGAFAGDNLSYFLGAKFGPAAERRFFAKPKGQAAKEWAVRSLRRFGIQLIIVCRFIPGGRTAVTLTCGLTRYNYRRFLVGTALAAVIWALYAFLIGRVGGKVFEDKPWVGFLVALGIVTAISGVVEVIRRIRARRRPPRPAADQAADQAEPGDT